MDHVISKAVLKELISQYPTPFYLYNKKAIINNIAEIKNAFPVRSFTLLFATMANDNPEFLEVLKEHNVGACINSIRHLDIVQDCGITNNEIQYTSTGVSLKELKILHERNITVNFDSANQIKHWCNLAPGNKMGIRVNTASLVPGTILADRLGIDKVDIPGMNLLAKAYGGIINGLHIYVGTNFKNHTEMMPFLKKFFELAATILELDYVNIGGGVGVNYLNEQEEFKLQEYGKNVCSLLVELNEKLQREIKLIFEPGRRLAASSGIFVTKVTDVKYLNKRRYLVVDSSIAVFPRPFHQPESPHPVVFPFKNGNAGYEDAIVVGKTTFSKDILLHTPLPRNIEEGDILVFEQAGAYCDSMRSRFLGQKEPINIFIDQ